MCSGASEPVSVIAVCVAMTVATRSNDSPVCLVRPWVRA